MSVFFFDMLFTGNPVAETDCYARCRIPQSVISEAVR